jgi:hypothetical protein
MYDPSQLYVDPILTGFSVGYKDQQVYGRQIMPVTPVNTQSGRYRVFDRSDWLIFPDRREPGTVANEVRGRKWSEDTFKTVEHSLQAPVHDEERQELNSQGGLANSFNGAALDINPERDAVELITRSLMLGHEQKVANLIRNTANYPAGNFVTLAGTQQWSDYTGGVSSTSDPVNDIRTARRTIFNLTGREPNLMVIPSQGIEYIENHPRIVARYSNFTLDQDNAWRQLSGFQGTVIAVDSGYNAADNIDATENFQYFWGKDVWIGVSDSAPGQNTKTFGKTFEQPYPAGARPTDRWREEPRKSDLFRVSWKYDLKIVSSQAGYIIKTAFGAAAW